MILRRLATALRRQDWFTVGVEIIIVVLGVFLGLQANNWNEARGNREIETQYLARLQSELTEMAPQAYAEFDEVRATHDLIVQAKDYFESGEGGEKLDGTHCAAIGRSHIFAGFIFYPPTIKELISTGRIVLIRDDALRTAILAFDRTNEESSQMRFDIQVDRLPLARKYPDLIQLGLSEWEDSTCSFDAMSVSAAFLNDFTDNRHRYEAYVYNVLGRQAELINALGAKVGANRNEPFMPLPRHDADGTESDAQRVTE